MDEQRFDGWVTCWPPERSTTIFVRGDAPDDGFRSATLIIHEQRADEPESEGQDG